MKEENTYFITKNVEQNHKNEKLSPEIISDNKKDKKKSQKSLSNNVINPTINNNDISE